ncbi:orn [Anthophora retusa]
MTLLICYSIYVFFAQIFNLKYLFPFPLIGSSIFFMDTKIEESNCSNIVWLDMEMTGLDISTSHILEVACLITDRNLEIISEDLNIVIHQSDEILDNMNDWCLTNHKRLYKLSYRQD